MLEKDLFAGIVTSLCFYNEEVLVVGHGPFLKLYNAVNGKLLSCKEVLPNNRIHRIVFVPDTDLGGAETKTLAVYGSKYIAIVDITVAGDDTSITITNSFGPFCDWIMDIQFLKTKEDGNYDQIAIAYAHNFVEVYNMTTHAKSIQLNVFYRVQCKVRCILYSARFYGTTLGDLVLASGTVFNQVHLWRVNDLNEDGDGQVSRELIGHEGVIFGVRFSQDGTMLASVSDDRTIRVWSLVNPKQAPLVVYGHTARVWDCQFVDDYLVSISEDSTCRVWKNGLVVTDEGDSSMDCLACWEGHVGKNVWSCAISPDHKMVATGGQDSGVRLWSLTSIKENNIDSEEDLICMRLTDQHRGDMIRNFALVNNNTIMASTDQGRLIKFDVSTKTPEWAEAYQDDDLKGYSALEQSKCGRLIVAGSMAGGLLFYSAQGEFQPVKLSLHSKSVFAVIIIGSQVNESIFYIVSYSFNSDVYFHRFDITDINKPSITTPYMIKLPEITTTVISAALVEYQGILILGSKEASIVIYRLPDLPNCLDNKLPIYSNIQVRRVHKKQGFSRITIKQSTKGQHTITSDTIENDSNCITFWTTGRDGCYNEYRLTILKSSAVTPSSSDDCVLGLDSRGDTVTESADLRLEKVYRNKVTKGWLEGAIFIDGELLLLGFYQKSFFVYNETKRYEMISVACGGAHRRWHFNTLDARLNNASFAFVRKEAIYAYIRDGTNTVDRFQESTLQQNYHGREVRTIKYLESPVNQDKASNPIIFATGGEDTVFRIHQYIPGDPSRFTTHSTIRKHNSVVKCLEWSRGIDTLLFTAGGKEEFRCWKLEIQDNQETGLIDVNCMEWATCPVVGDERIETRIMDLTTKVIDASLGLHLIGVVYSDAMIRVWLFDEKIRKFSLLVDGTWHAKCILQITHVTLRQENGQDRILFFTSATDGNVAMWDINDELSYVINNRDSKTPDIRLTEPLSYYQAHMSGVNALQVAEFDENLLLVVTGGEDNAVTATWMNKTDGKVAGSCTIPNAHASSVNGIYIGDNHQLATISTDQRFNLWSVVQDQASIKLDLKDSVYVDIPDPSALDGMRLDGTTHFMLTGIGLQSLQLKP
ncbi:WD40-repeat-containing domain protein [Chlamydoabsidia padenii]|nr:WD40-repeat-containing domain protein [Chlamydoabsidia padenii]